MDVGSILRSLTLYLGYSVVTFVIMKWLITQGNHALYIVRLIYKNEVLKQGQGWGNQPQEDIEFRNMPKPLKSFALLGWLAPAIGCYGFTIGLLLGWVIVTVLVFWESSK